MPSHVQSGSFLALCLGPGDCGSEGLTSSVGSPQCLHSSAGDQRLPLPGTAQCVAVPQVAGPGLSNAAHGGAYPSFLLSSSPGVAPASHKVLRAVLHCALGRILGSALWLSPGVQFPGGPSGLQHSLPVGTSSSEGFLLHTLSCAHQDRVLTLSQSLCQASESHS